ncbi:MAG: hypothetical protein ABF285_13640 [Pacificibacter sp.]|jgi:hypothetical protein|uniref:hypothetical protein n=1 Tax=Pacificibacter sp. TaxID=1917866 RepID=UPI00321BEDE3
MLKSAFISAALLAFSATSLAASEPLSGAQFDAYATGKTLTFAEDGRVYGAEQYLPNNRVRWAYNADTCMEGIWYEKEDNICFVYEDGGTPQCWSFYLEGERLKAVFNGESGTELYEATQTDGPLACMAPGLGV